MDARSVGLACTDNNRRATTGLDDFTCYHAFKAGAEFVLDGNDVETEPASPNRVDIYLQVFGHIV